MVTGFVTALMGFYVSLRGDPRALSVRQVRHHPMNPHARTAIVMPICNEDVATVFAGLRATCESVAATGHGRAFDVFVLSDTNRPELAAAERVAWEELRAALAEHDGQPQIEVYYAAARSAGPTARRATWPISAGAGARTTATWWCWTPTA